jgi:hypothetical protein
LHFFSSTSAFDAKILTRRANFFVGNSLFICIDIAAIIGLRTKIIGEQIIPLASIKRTNWLFQKIEERP